MADAKKLTRAGAFFLLLASTARADPSPFQSVIRPLMARYCFTCHGPKKQESGLDLARVSSEAALLTAQKTWKNVWRRVDSREMPPPEAAEPSAAERRQITDYLESTLAKMGEHGARDPGRVVIRRLNRTEYGNTIRDLIGVAAKTDNFPSDDVGYGFDDIGDVLSLPPLLMEKYLDAAEKIIDRAIFPRPPRGVPIQHFSGRDLSVTLGGTVRFDPPTLVTNAELYRYVDAPSSGRYVIRVRAAGDQAGSEPVKMAVRVDGSDLQTFEVPAVRGNPSFYEVEVTLKPGLRRIGAALLNQYRDASSKKPSDRSLIVHYLEVDGPQPPSFSELPESHRRIFLAYPQGKKDDRAAAREVLTAFITRAFRRPVADAEIDKYVALFELAERRGAPFETAMKVPLVATLVSPHFLFRVERDRPQEGPEAVHLIDDFEMASRLSYFLWSSMPDDALSSAASRGTLRTPEGIEGEVKRMLADPKSKALAENFTTQWLQIRRMEGVTPDAQRFPDFDDRLREAMIEEPVLLFETLLSEDRSLVSLLDADFTFLNERLARHYGIEGVLGPDMRRVALSDARRGGILTMGSVLTSTSTPARTSPVKRGKWVLESILGTPPPPPAPDVGALRENRDDLQKLTVRQRMEQHRQDPNCASCHARMDPLGFALEHYDAIGAWRESDEGLAIDARAALPDGRTFEGAGELRSLLLARRADFVRCLTEKMLTYALGRGLEFSDRVTVREIDTALEHRGFRLSALVIEIAKSYPFRYRRDSRGRGDPATGKGS